MSFEGVQMSTENNKQIVRRFIEAYNNRKLDLIDDFIASDYVDHTNKLDRNGLKQMIGIGINAFPDWNEAIEDIIAEGDKVWVLISYTGTHKGQFMGLPPTDRKITSKAVDIYRVVDGKLAEYWNVTDNVNILKQTGAIEVTDKGKVLFPEDTD
jgi:C-1 hydroxylase